jgi:uncharacterized protein (DUF1697 family)
MNAGPTRYVALLRAVNLGGHKRVAMPQLRQVVAELGYDDVVTYINSGNVAFTAATGTATEHAAVITAALESDLALSTTVIVRSAEDLRAVVDTNPYTDGDPSRVMIVFLDRVLDEDQRQQAAVRAAEVATQNEEVTVAPDVVYLHLPDGIGRSRLGANLDRATGEAVGTARNLRTTVKLLDLVRAG